jgi:hypothetical protein
MINFTESELLLRIFITTPPLRHPGHQSENMCFLAIYVFDTPRLSAMALGNPDDGPSVC